MNEWIKWTKMNTCIKKKKIFKLKKIQFKWKNSFSQNSSLLWKNSNYFTICFNKLSYKAINNFFHLILSWFLICLVILCKLKYSEFIDAVKKQKLDNGWLIDLNNCVISGAPATSRLDNGIKWFLLGVIIQ